MTARRALLLPLLALLSACAMAPPAAPASGGQPQQTTMAQPHAQPTAAQSTAPRSDHSPFAEPPPPPSATTPGLHGQPAVGGGAFTQREVDIMAAVIELQRTAFELQTSLTACDVACRSLASIERSVRVICSLVNESEKARCDDARARLREARVKVRDACGQCGNGARTDPDAPDP